ncbi:xylulose kinase isoform X2 [Ooceraea biroi]|uniref:xylulose kinase isoform X2 n=1 Tax=Ooceraea biroi TaxID=2015173 RepID=UPI0005BB45A7|nr:xylulose kinase isoform X2 [Ooceraea biroi]
MDGPSAATYLGLDLSTQQLKAVVVDDSLAVLHQTSVQFDNDLPEFRTYGGVIQKVEAPHVVVVPTLMWVKALDLILDKLRVCGVDFSKVSAVSGCAQQHGTVYWGKGSRNRLQHLDPIKFLHEQFATSFSVTHSPVWLDSSTVEQCDVLEEIVGGPQKLAEITGSRAYHRFSGPQIAKIARTKPEAYCNTERISLVSSFLASLFLGDYAPTDWSDGSGMNLLNIRTKDWEDVLLETCASGLREKLGKPVSSCSNIGPISPYFVERFGFNEECRVIAFTGDNPGSLLGHQRHPVPLAERAEDRHGRSRAVQPARRPGLHGAALLQERLPDAREDTERGGAGQLADIQRAAGEHAARQLRQLRPVLRHAGDPAVHPRRLQVQQGERRDLTVQLEGGGGEGADRGSVRCEKGARRGPWVRRRTQHANNRHGRRVRKQGHTASALRRVQLAGLHYGSGKLGYDGCGVSGEARFAARHVQLRRDHALPAGADSHVPALRRRRIHLQAYDGALPQDRGSDIEEKERTQARVINVVHSNEIF